MDKHKWNSRLPGPASTPTPPSGVGVASGLLPVGPPAQLTLLPSCGRGLWERTWLTPAPSLGFPILSLDRRGSWGPSRTCQSRAWTEQDLAPAAQGLRTGCAPDENGRGGLGSLWPRPGCRFREISENASLHMGMFHTQPPEIQSAHSPSHTLTIQLHTASPWQPVGLVHGC